MGRASSRKASATNSQANNPPDAEYEDGVLRWFNAALTEGLAANRSQYNYDKIGQAIDAMMGVDEPTIRSPRLSNARVNKIQKIALELRSMLTDIKLFWTYTTNCPRYERQADIFGKLAKSWYLRRGVDQTFRDAIDYVLAAGSGYIHLFWNPELPGPVDMHAHLLQGDIDARAEDPRDVIPIRLSGDKRSLQSARGVIIRRERATSWYEDFYGAGRAAGIKPDRVGLEKESPSQRRAREMEDSIMSQGGNWSSQLFGGGAPANRMISGPVPVTDEFTAYLHDFSVNESSKAKEMGPFMDAVDGDGQKVREPAAPWSYIVQPGEPLYPFGRRIVATRYGVLEDGPKQTHHGHLDVCKVTLDTWAWSWLGTSPIHPLLSLQREADVTVRAIGDHVRRSSKRGVIYDKKAVSPAVARKLDARQPGMKLGINPHAAGPKGAIQMVDEPPLNPAVTDWLKFLFDMMDELSGVANLRGLAELNQMPSAETIDQLVQAMTPLVRARSRAMEVFIREFAMMLASMFMEFYPVDLRMRMLGADGVTFEDWDYRAGDLVPDYVNDEDYENVGDAETNGAAGPLWRVTQEAMDRGPSADHIRNREFLRFFEYDIAPGTLLDYAKIAKKLLYLQLSRMGLVDHWTLGEVMEIPNQGKPPSWATTITLRLQAEKIMGLGVISSTQGRAPTAQVMPHMGQHGINES